MKTLFLTVAADLALSASAGKSDKGLITHDYDYANILTEALGGVADYKHILNLDEESARIYDETLVVHLVHHSHTDIGWLKTKDEYYLGENSEVQDTASVRQILDSAIDALLKDERRKFTFSNMSFMERWWNEQDRNMKEKVRDLVQLGRLELANGGYVQHDEATTSYEDILVNLMKGSMFVYSQFDVQPRVGWQLDTMGHSNTSARMFAEMGMDALFISRGDSDDKEMRMREKRMEFVWHPSFRTQGEEASIFTHWTYNGYKSPDGLDFDVRAEDPVDWNDRSAINYSTDFHTWIMSMADAYRVEDSNNLMVLMGDEFNFSDAEDYFTKSQKLIDYFNENTGKMFNIELKFSTPSEYIDAIAEKDIEWSNRYADMLPYSDTPNAYWTGSFTSRPQLKSYIRKASAAYHGASKLLALTQITNIRQSDIAKVHELKDSLSHMESVLAEMQNKDTISGTSSMRVINDNMETLSLALTATYEIYSQLIHHFMKINYVQTHDENGW